LPGAKARSTLALATGCMIAGNCAMLHSQSDAETGTGVITSGPFSLEPRLTTEISYDDNIFESDTDEVDSWVARIKPMLITGIKVDGQVYTLAYEGDYGRYAQSSDDDYDDHYFSAEADLNLNLRNYVNLGAAYTLGHEDRGTGITEGINPVRNPLFNEPLELDTTEFDAEYAYGATDYTGRIVLAGGYRDLQYQNFRNQTRYQDQEHSRAGATFYYKVLPATSLLFEIRAQQVRYDVTRLGTVSLDSKSIYYLVGATWNITELTSGTIKLGQVERTFDDKAREDFSGFNWEVDISWLPRSYSRIDLVTTRQEREAYGKADFIDEKLYAATWTHGWTDDLETRLEAAYMDESFQGEDRDQQTSDYGIALNYQWRSWLSFELGASLSDRDSNIDTLEYQRTIYRLSANLSLR
jgi:polysaccharide biosynthesis protein VpsM